MTEERIDTICRNLHVIGDVCKGDKLTTKGDLIEVDKWSVIQPFTRWWTDQASEHNLILVERNVQEAEDFIISLLKIETQPQPPSIANKDGDVVNSANRFKNTQKILRIRQAMVQAIKGLKQLESSYEERPSSKRRITILASKVQSTLQTIDYILSSIPTLKLNPTHGLISANLQTTAKD